MESKLPPNQIETKKFPVVGETTSSNFNLENWKLSISGEVLSPMEWSYKEFCDLPQRDFQMDIHCVTGWSRLNATFTGVPLKDLLDLFSPSEKAKFIRFIAYSTRNHDTSLKLEVAKECWLVHSMDGQPLTKEHGFPLRLVTPSKYFYKSLKWIHKIILMNEDQLGFWERDSAYHNEADPWQEQRFDETKKVSPEELEHFKALTSFDEYRNQNPVPVLLRGNFSNWTPLTKDLSGIHLKFCKFRRANLQGANLRNANFSLSNFQGCHLENADFTNADLEGADFSSANLENAIFTNVALSATKFFRMNNQSRMIAANVKGAKFVGHQGLLEEQEVFLRENGAIFL